MSNLTTDLQDLLNDVDVPFHYRLRRWADKYGRTCAAVEVDTVNCALRYMLALGQLVEESGSSGLNVERILNNVDTKIGRHEVILYWPDIAAPACDADEEGV
jgi:hypothetical protein